MSARPVRNIAGIQIKRFTPTSLRYRATKCCRHLFVAAEGNPRSRYRGVKVLWKVAKIFLRPTYLYLDSTVFTFL